MIPRTAFKGEKSLEIGSKCVRFIEWEFIIVRIRFLFVLRISFFACLNDNVICFFTQINGLAKCCISAYSLAPEKKKKEKHEHLTE